MTKVIYGDIRIDIVEKGKQKLLSARTRTQPWKCRVSIPMPLACKVSTLPFQLLPRIIIFFIKLLVKVV